MKHYLLLPIAAAFMVSPVMAQSNSDNLETQEDVIRGAEESEMRGAPDLYQGELRTGRNAADSGTNSENLVTHEDVWRGAERSSGRNVSEEAADDLGSAID